MQAPAQQHGPSRQASHNTTYLTSSKSNSNNQEGDKVDQKEDSKAMRQTQIKAELT